MEFIKMRKITKGLDQAMDLFLLFCPCLTAAVLWLASRHCQPFLNPNGDGELSETVDLPRLFMTDPPFCSSHLRLDATST